MNIRTMLDDFDARYAKLREALDGVGLFLQDEVTGLLHPLGPRDAHPLAPSPACLNCSGGGEVSAGSVPYSTGSVLLPPEPCDACLGLGIDLSRAKGFRDSLNALVIAAMQDAAREAHIQGRVYHQGGEKETPGEVDQRLCDWVVRNSPVPEDGL